MKTKTDNRNMPFIYECPRCGHIITSLYENQIVQNKRQHEESCIGKVMKLKGIKTEHEASLTERMNKQNKKWKCAIIGTIGGAVLTTEFDSEHNSLENVLHKVRLDLMTYLSNGFTSPIQIIISEVDA